MACKTTLKCNHCGSTVDKNPRLKVPQRYCGNAACQKARKNAWERDRQHSSAAYKSSRRASHKRWQQKTPPDQYQRDYREKHPDYCECNRKSQKGRNKKRCTQQEKGRQPKTDALSHENQAGKEVPIDLPGICLKIVKTDASSSKNLTGHGFQGDLTALLEKIVKTDALKLQILVPRGFGHGFT